MQEMECLGDPSKHAFLNIEVIKTAQGKAEIPLSPKFI
jgi:hypothetical protein